ncbi:cysteine proteinase [Hypoxylon sp. FL1284]|nr:cysteine proteinase [Hypoxylon sp. FL1284]
MPLTRTLFKHDWRSYNHCIICLNCRAIRARTVQERQTAAYQAATSNARDVGAPTDAAPIYHRLVSIPRSKRSVLIQLPYMRRPVAPSDTLTLKSRKRRYAQTRPPRPSIQRRLDAWSRQPELSELTLGSTEVFAPVPEQARHPWSAQYPQHSRPGPFYESDKPVKPVTHIYTPEFIPPLDLELRRYLQRPIPTSGPHWKLPSVPSERKSYSMPGAWPSELDDEDVEPSTNDGTTTDNNMTSAGLFGINIYNTVSLLRDTYNKIFHPNQRAPTAPTSTSEDDEPASKRRRVGAEEHYDGVSKAESDSHPQSITRSGFDSSSFGDAMDIDSISIEQRDTVDISPPESPTYSSTSYSPIARDTARRAALFVYNGKKSLPRSTKTQMVTPPPEGQEQRSTTRNQSTSPAVVYERPPPPPRYNSLHEFFTHEREFSLPGLEELHLTPNVTKISELDTQLQDRLEKERQEHLRKKQEAANKRLAACGLRKGRAGLITPLSDDWERRVAEAPHNGRSTQVEWGEKDHRDGEPLKPYDFSRLVPARAWLNDNAIQTALLHLALFINDAAGVAPRKSTPKCVAIGSHYWESYRSNPKSKLYPRGFKITWGMHSDNFLDIETVLIPINRNNHWTVLVIRPSRRTIAYLDSFYGPPAMHIRHGRGWLEQFLGPKYVASEWRDEVYDIPRQTNGYDCGVFVITNSICLALGIDPCCYDEEDLPLQRRRIAAVLLNGGFTGPFDLSHL